VQSNVITGSDSTPVYRVRKIGPTDLKDALAKVSPISRRNLHTRFFGLIYPLVGSACSRRVSAVDLPLLSGFALIGPLRALACMK